MAIIDLNEWIPEEWGGEAVKRYRQASAVLTIGGTPTGRLEAMSARKKHVPKDSTMDVGFIVKGQAYGIDDDAVEDVELTNVKLGGRADFAEEDVEDASAFVDAVKNKREGGFSGLAVLFDNASLAVTGAQTNGTSDVSRPYRSVYRAVAEDNPTAIFTDDYTSGTPATFRDAVLQALSIAEESEFASDDIVWVGHSFFKTNLRNDIQDGSSGTPLWDAAGGTIAGYPVYWTRGARLSAVATSKPTVSNGTIGSAGNPILIAVPRALLIPGRHTGPANRNGSGEAFEWMVTDPKTGPGAASDTMYLKVRGRLAFQLGDGDSAGIVEATE